MSRRRSLVITTGIVVATGLATVAATAAPPGRADTGCTHPTEHMGELDARAWDEMEALMDHGAMHGRGTGSMHGHATRDGSHP